MKSTEDSARFPAREGFVQAAGARLHFREIGRGQPLMILHGGPDFDHQYLLPGMDMLADACRLIYYDQRGRGQSSDGVRPKDVSMQSEMQDLDLVRQFFGLESAAVLGHSWGGLLATEYALAHPERVSHLILLNTGPASREDYVLLREHRRKKSPAVMQQLQALASNPVLAEGDLQADAAYYRIHFGNAFTHDGHLEALLAALRRNFTKEGVRKARSIEDRLMAETWSFSGYDLLPRLAGLRIPTLLIHGDHDLVPQECAAHIASAIPEARLVVLKDCGHFSFIECPGEVHEEIIHFLRS